jgi:hypothetical protein
MPGGAGRTAGFALELLQRRFDVPGEEPMARFTADNVVYSLTTPLSQLYPRFLNTYRLALERGDLFTAGPCLYQYCVLSLHAGRPLAGLEALIREQHARQIDMNNRMLASVLEHLLQLVKALRGDAGAVADLLNWQIDHQSPIGLRVVRSQLLALQLLGQSQAALALILAAGSAPQPVLPGIPNEYYRCLILLDCYPMASEAQREHYLALVDKYQHTAAVPGWCESADRPGQLSALGRREQMPAAARTLCHTTECSASHHVAIPTADTRDARRSCGRYRQQPYSGSAKPAESRSGAYRYA